MVILLDGLGLSNTTVTIAEVSVQMYCGYLYCESYYMLREWGVFNFAQYTHNVITVDFSCGQKLCSSTVIFSTTNKQTIKNILTVIIVLFVFFIKLKKDSWRSNSTTTNKIATGNFEQCEMGQLLSYLYGMIIDAIQNGKAVHRLLNQTSLNYICTLRCNCNR